MISVVCSKCGGTDLLNLITLVTDEHERIGRVLVYCADCRVDRSNFGVSIPLPLIDEDLFVDLYRLGYTESPPDIAADIVFGRSSGPVVERAEAILQSRR